MSHKYPPPTEHAPPNRDQALAQYKARAGRYDAELLPFESLRRDAIARLQLKPGDAVLDVGCGTGLSFAPLLENLGPRGRIVGIEQCPEMMAQARDRVRAGGWRRVSLIQAPAEEALWRGLADAALFHFTHDILCLPTALDNTFSHLRPGSRVVATGLQWAQPWAWPVNLFVLGAASCSVTSFDTMERPWCALAERLDDFEVHPTWMGSIFMATGVSPR